MMEGISKFSKKIITILLIGICSGGLGVLEVKHLNFIILVTLAAIVLIIVLEIQCMEILIFCLPIMFYFNIGITFNMSVADFILPIMLIHLIMISRDIKLPDSKKSFILAGNYGFLILFTMSLSMINFYFTGANIAVSGIAAMIKLVINIAYMFAVLGYFFLEKEHNELRFLKVWNAAAVFFSISCIAGSILYSMGIDLGMTYASRAKGTFEDPNLAASYLILSIGIASVYNLKIQRKKIQLNILIIFTALLLTASKGGNISLILALLVTSIISLSKGSTRSLLGRVGWFLACLAVLYWISIIFSVPIVSHAIERVRSIGEGDEGTLGRVFLWTTAFKIGLSHPLIGIGIGQFKNYATMLVGYSVESLPHNTYFSFFAETGLLGLGSFLWLPIMIFKKLFLIVRSGEESAFFLFLSLVGILFSAFSINLENFRGLWVYLAYIMYYVQQKEVTSNTMVLGEKHSE